MNANAATTPPASAPVKLGEAMAARRTPEQARAWRTLRRRELLTSLWAPLTLLGIAFIPYLLFIENVPSAGEAAQAVMKAFALVLFLYYVALVGWRLASGRERTLRRLRHEARELLSEDEWLMRRHASKVTPQASEKLTEQALRVEDASVAGDTERLAKEIKALDALTAECLGAYRKQSWWHAASGFIFFLGIAVLFRMVLIEPYRIPSGSMLPTLEIGDQVFVNKFLYGVRIPLINKVPFQIVRPPKRGDVIVFNNPVNEADDFIKRVVGIPGDRVEIIDEIVHINGVPQARKLVSDDFLVHNKEPDGPWFDQRESFSVENLDGVEHAVLQDRHHPRGHVTEGPYIVPENTVFVMGDNRDNSSDSRYGLGGRGGMGAAYVPYGHIKGKAMVVWLSLGYDGLFSGLFGGTGLRVDRLFEPVR
ncbi:signal peptidase I [Myxococcaceae bacterium GXIMD 01537]